MAMLTGPIQDAITEAALDVLSKFLVVFIRAAMVLLENVFKLVDATTVFSVDKGSGPVGAVWPVMMTIGIAIALILFFWQLGTAVVKADPTALGTAVIGAVKFALVTIAIVVVTQTVNGLCDELANWILSGVDGSGKWSGIGEEVIYSKDDVDDLAADAVAAGILFVVGFFSLFGALLLWIEFAFRQVAVMTLVATSPIAAAGLLSEGTQVWFKKVVRWTLALLLAKPAVALVLLVSTKLMSDYDGINGILGGMAALGLAVFAPFALLRLFSFVDGGGGGNAGATMKRWAGGAAAGFGGAAAGAAGAAGAQGPAGADGGSAAAASTTEAATDSRLSAATSRFGAVAGPMGQAAGMTLSKTDSAAHAIGDPMLDHLDEMDIGETSGGGVEQATDARHRDIASDHSPPDSNASTQEGRLQEAASKAAPEAEEAVVAL